MIIDNKLVVLVSPLSTKNLQVDTYNDLLKNQFKNYETSNDIKSYDSFPRHRNKKSFARIMAEFQQRPIKIVPYKFKLLGVAEKQTISSYFADILNQEL